MFSPKNWINLALIGLEPKITDRTSNQFWSKLIKVASVFPDDRHFKFSDLERENQMLDQMTWYIFENSALSAFLQYNCYAKKLQVKKCHTCKWNIYTQTHTDMIYIHLLDLKSFRQFWWLGGLLYHWILPLFFLFIHLETYCIAFSV